MFHWSMVCIENPRDSASPGMCHRKAVTYAKLNRFDTKASQVLKAHVLYVSMQTLMTVFFV